MALKVVNTESLDAVANAINAKSGTSGAIQFPEGFVNAIQTMSGGGEDLSTVLAEQEELVAELKSVIAQKAMGDENPLAHYAEGTITVLNPTNLAGCTTIGEYAFYNNRIFKNITLPDTVTSIGEYAFGSSYCPTVYLPDSVVNISGYAFMSAKLTSVRLPNNPNLKIGSAAFQSNSALTSLDVPSGEIGSSAFAYCSALHTVTIGENVTKIGAKAFSYLSALKTIYYNAISVANCSGYPFRDAATSTSNTGATCYIGNKVKRIPKGLFEDHYNKKGKLIAVIFEDGSVCEKIGSEAMRTNGYLANIKLPKSVTSIGSYAFYYCSALEYIDLTDYGASAPFPTLDYYAFDGCGTSTTNGTFEIRVPSGRKAELAAMTNWSTYADNIVEV